MSCDLLYCNICFTAVVWNQIHRVADFCLQLSAQAPKSDCLGLNPRSAIY